MPELGTVRVVGTQLNLPFLGASLFLVSRQAYLASFIPEEEVSLQCRPRWAHSIGSS